jgi:hypothetical protein
MDQGQSIVTREIMPAQQRQECLSIDKGANAIIMRVKIAIATMVKMPAH